MIDRDRARLVGKELQVKLSSAEHSLYFHGTSMLPFLREGDLVVVRPIAQRDSEILLNDWDEGDVLLDDTAGGERSCITAICSNSHKGVGIFLELARRFPDERFMLLGEPGSDIPPNVLGDAAACRNLELPGRMRPREFLARSKLVLVLSHLPESWTE